MDVIIELISRSRRVIERHRFNGPNVSLGRAYDNDLIISDPHLSPHHAVLTDLGEQGWWLEDLNSKNGIYTRKNQRIHTRTRVVSGDEIIMGKTHLRFYDRLHDVPAAISMNPVEKIIRPLSIPGNALVFMLLLLAYFTMNSYMDLYVQFGIRPLFANALGVLLLGMGWALVWALIGRLVKHDARFLTQLVISMAYLACVVFLSDSIDVLSFNYSSGQAVFVMGVIGNLLLFAVLLWMNLYVAVGQTDRRRLLISGGISAFLAVIILVYHFFSVREFSPRPEYVYFLKPPALQWFSPVDSETFLRDTESVFTVTGAQAAEP